MSNTPHELIDEFPEYAALMPGLKESDAHFAKLFDDYHEVNRAVHRAETNVEPVADLVSVEMRKRRVALKDELYSILSAAAGAENA